MIVPRTTVGPGDVARHYGALDVFYRDLWGEHVHHGLWTTGRETPDEAVVALAEHVADGARVTAGDRVVDIGCGYGGTARRLAARGAHVVGVTITPEQAAHARTQGSDPANPCYLVRDWLHNGLPEASFDAAIAIESTEHMADKARCFAEAARVLRDGGRLVVCAWLARDEAGPWETRWLLEPICREGRLPGLGSEPEYRRLLADAGFRLERVEDVSARVRRTWTICARRLAGAVARDARYRRALRDPALADRVFARTLLRIWAAYRTGAMRYGIFTGVKDGARSEGRGASA